ncbi:SRPBCC family protein [Oryzobacter sp. R7]|uniref:SRPBCC family protein n=1 Tax=Oryzobacter faecalis TaxID=3388656 RepID=UPI00398CD56D
MELSHSFTVPASVDDTWATFMDLEQVGGCFPGATVTEVADDSFAGTVKVRLGPIALQYAGSGRFVERDDVAHRAVIDAKGKDKRGNGTAGATVTIQLAPDGSGTKVDVATDLQVTGKPAQFGRGVMQDVSDKLLGQFVGCIEGRLAAVPAAETAPAPEVVDSPAPATAAAASPVPAPLPTTPSPVPRAAPTPTEQEDSIDLGATVLPVLARTYGGYVLAGIAGLVIGWLIGRGGS